MKYITILFLILLSTTMIFSSIQNTLISTYSESYLNDTPLKPLKEKNIHINILDSYFIQKEWISTVMTTYPKTGIKSELTNPDEQKKHSVNSPILNILIPKETHKNFSIIEQKKHHLFTLTPKVAITLNKNITQPIKNIYKLQSYIKSASFYIELTQNKYKKNTTLEYNDLIINNSQTHSLIKGETFKFSQNVDLNLNIKNNQRTIYNKPLTLDQEDILTNVLWSINNALKLKWTLSKGEIILSNKLIEPIPLNKGIYTFDFNPISAMVFQIK